MSNYIFLATSLDGFIAARDGSLDWLTEIPNPENSDYGFADFMAGIDAVVMGRKTFETVLGFGEWPYAKPTFVLSSSLDGVPERLAGKVELASGDPHGVVAQLNKRGYYDLYVDGGQTVQRFLEADLIDEMIITRAPILLGEGIPLFGALSRRLKFRHAGTETFNGMLTKSYYVRDRG